MTSSVEILTAATRQPIKRNGPVRHLPAAQWLHWATAALITLLVTAGVLMTQLGEGQAADLLFILHKTAGAAAFVLVLTRLAYRLAKRLSGRWHAHSGAHELHRMLYCLAVAVPLFGWAGVSAFDMREIVFGLSLPPIWPANSSYADLLLTFHAYLAFALVATVVLHIGVALRDHVMRGSAGEVDTPT